MYYFAKIDRDILNFSEIQILADENRKFVWENVKLEKFSVASENCSEIGESETRGKCIISSGGWTPLIIFINNFNYGQVASWVSVGLVLVLKLWNIVGLNVLGHRSKFSVGRLIIIVQEH